LLLLGAGKVGTVNFCIGVSVSMQKINKFETSLV
jgi:hypothetical protein